MNDNRGKPLPAAQIKHIQQVKQVNSIRGTARETGVSRNTVRKYVRGGQ